MDKFDENGKLIVEEVKEEEFVSKKAYEEVTVSMHKQKEEARKAKAELARIQAEIDAQRKATAEEKGEFKRLWEQELEEKNALKAERLAEKEKFINHHKRSAVIELVGAFKKAEYANTINVSAIELDENDNIIKSSVEAEANRIRQNYPELLAVSTSTHMPATAPKTGATPQKSLAEMSERERNDLIKEHIKSTYGK